LQVGIAVWQLAKAVKLRIETKAAAPMTSAVQGMSSAENTAEPSC
jgi:hypothetical protein